MRLIIKTSNSSAFPTGIGSIKEVIGSTDNIVLIDRTMTAVEIEALYNEGDVAMSLHRSEGFGLMLAEAMLRGLPVVATDWSGSIDFVTPETGMPVAYRQIPAEDPQGTYHHPGMVWADADVDVAADALQKLFRELELARRLGAAGAAYATRAWSATSYTGRLRRYVAL